MPRLYAPLLVTVIGCLVPCCGGTQTASQAPLSASVRGVSKARATPDPEAFRNTEPKPGPATPVQFPTPVMKTLKNGVTLFVVPKHSAVTTLTVVARHGSGTVPLGKSGLAALTARMLTESTTQRSSLALAEACEALGSSLQADA